MKERQKYRGNCTLNRTQIKLQNNKLLVGRFKYSNACHCNRHVIEVGREAPGSKTTRPTPTSSRVRHPASQTHCLMSRSVSTGPLVSAGSMSAPLSTTARPQLPPAAGCRSHRRHRPVSNHARASGGGGRLVQGHAPAAVPVRPSSVPCRSRREGLGSPALPAASGDSRGATTHTNTARALCGSVASRRAG